MAIFCAMACWGNNSVVRILWLVPWWCHLGSCAFSAKYMTCYVRPHSMNIYMGMGQDLVPLVNIKIAGKWMFIPLKMVLIGIDPYPSEYKLPLKDFQRTWIHRDT